MYSSPYDMMCRAYIATSLKQCSFSISEVEPDIQDVVR
jgi:hypothetical protein